MSNDEHTPLPPDLTGRERREAEHEVPAPPTAEYDFVGLPGLYQSPPPYYFRDVQVREFRLEADIDALQRLCDAYLNWHPQFAPHAWSPIFGQVSMMLATYGRMSGAHEADGFATQHELAFQILLDGPATVAWFAPFLVVDNPLSLINGREVAGFPKALGSFEIATGAPWLPAEISTWAFRKGVRGDQLLPRPLVSIARAGDSDDDGVAADDPRMPWPGISLAEPALTGAAEDKVRERIARQKHAAPEVVTRADGTRSAALPAQGPILNEVDAIQFCEFRDFVDPRRAAYRSINMATYEVYAPQRLPRRLPESRVTVHRYRNIDLVSLFGLTTLEESGDRASVAVESARASRFDFNLVDPRAP